MACGAPVLSFAVGGTPEIVKDGENGFLAPAYDIEKYADLLLKLIFDSKMREQMGLNGRKIIEEKFKLSDQATSYLELFRELSKGIKTDTYDYEYHSKSDFYEKPLKLSTNDDLLNFINVLNENHEVSKLVDTIMKYQNNRIYELESAMGRFYSGYSYRLGHALLWPVKKILGKLK